MRWTLVVAACAGLAACNLSRDEADEAQEKMFDQVLAERREQVANREERQREQDAIRQRLALFVPLTAADLVTLAGAGAKIAKEADEAFYRVVTVSAPGAKADALRFARAALGRSNGVAPMHIALRDGTWEVSLALVSLPTGKPRAKANRATRGWSADTSWCYATCRERQRRITDKVAEIERLEDELGGLSSLNRDKKELQEMLDVRGALAAPEARDALDVLDGATWFGVGAAARFAKRTVTIPAPADNTIACNESFGALGACTWDSKRGQLEIELAPGPR